MTLKRFLGIVSMVIMGGITAAYADTKKITIVDIEALSGPFASSGLDNLQQVRFAVDTFLDGKVVNGEKLEVEVLGLDGQLNPKESLVQLKKAIAQDVQYVFHVSGSHISHALVDALEKHNRRHPDRRVLYLNLGAVDPALTNEKCSFWQFRFHPHADMMMNGITEVMRRDEQLKSVYIIGQDYTFGRAVSAVAKKHLAEKRPDIKIAGDELHPIGKIKDFTPYAQKIQASGAQAIITANWGADMINLAKSIKDVGLDSKIYTFYGAGPGISAILGEKSKGQVYTVSGWHGNPPQTNEWADYIRAYKDQFPGSDISIPSVVDAVQMLGKAFEAAKSTDPVKVAKALEGMSHTNLAGDVVTMRTKDHQILMPIHIAVHTNEGVTFDFDDSGYAPVLQESIPVSRIQTETNCNMNRPE